MTKTKTTRFRSTNIHGQLNRQKCRALKFLEAALKGQSISTTQIQASQAVLTLLSHYESGLEL